MSDKQFYQQFFDKVNEGIILIDNKMQIIDVNAQISAIVKLQKSELIGKSISEVLMIDNLSELIEKIFEKNNVLDNYEIELNYGNRIYHLILSATKLESGGFITLKDVSQLKQLQDRIQLEASMNLLSIMARGISHDFNNLLMGISGSLNLLILDSKSLSPTQRKFLLDAQKALFQATGLVKQFQNLTREDKPRNIKIDIFSALKNVFSFLDRTSSKVIDKKINFEANSFYVFADPVKINQVFLNLATNSINAMGDSKTNGFIQVFAKYATSAEMLKRGKTGNNYVHIIFEDNGSGIPEDMLDKIFIPFYSSKDDSSNLRGLGLPITYDIITRQFNGLIEVESIPGKSTKIHLYIPGMQIDEEEFKLIEHSDLPQGNETILIADDEYTVRNVLTVTLEQLGYRIIQARDGSECMDKYLANKDSIALILLDITMPKKSGVEVMKEVRAYNKDIKIIISSGHTEEEIHKGILAKAQGHLNKPYDREVLAKLVREIIDS